jgi:hypothetical protein
MMRERTVLARDDVHGPDLYIPSAIDSIGSLLMLHDLIEVTFR